MAVRRIYIIIEWACVVLLTGVIVPAVDAQIPVAETFTLFDGEMSFQTDGSRGPFSVSKRPIVAESETVWINGRQLIRDRDYVMQAERALLTFLRETERGVNVVIRFRQVPQVTQSVLRRRVLKRAEGRESEPIAPAFVSRQVKKDDVSGLRIGGHKSVAVTVGSHHAVNQALQLRISGEVTDGIDLLAVLSDRNLPVGEQGSSRRLQELDRVFFQVNTQNTSATLGDLEIAFDETVFGRYRRQLQGAHISSLSQKSKLTAFGAVSRGQWKTQRLVPVEGFQGPYRVAKGVGQIVPESERIYLNGRLLKQGDRLDYTVDYDRGSITFAPEIYIGAETRITAEYQIVENGLRSRLVGLESDISLTDGLSVGTTLIRESDRSVLPEVTALGLGGAQRQLGVVQAAYHSDTGVRLGGEFAVSDRDEGRGRAFRMNGEWAGDHVEITGQFRQLGADFEAFERLDRGDAAGRWGWQADTIKTAQREGEVAMKYRLGAFSIDGVYGRHAGTIDTDRKSIGFQFPIGTYRYESLGRGNGHMTRQQGQLEMSWGMVTPGFQFSLENGTGEGVQSSSLFYAFRPQDLPEGIGRRELLWRVVVGEGRKWEWASELKYRHFRQRNVTWQDSLRSWSHTHRAEVSNWNGWVLGGSYTQGVTHTGVDHQQNTHLGRVRIGHSRPGLSHQITYRISSTGVQISQPVFVEVASGLGEYIWEDANEDGVQDFEEFVPDVDGDYVQIFDLGSALNPARDGALGIRAEVDFRRLIGQDHWMSPFALDVSLRADRQIATDQSGAAPWGLLGFDSGAGILSGRRDALVRLYLFRYHKRGSLRLSGRVRNLVHQAFYGGAAEDLFEGNVLGKIRLENNFEFESEVGVGRRARGGAGSFAYDIDAVSGVLRGVFRPGRKWHVRLAMQGGRDRDEVRALRAVYGSVQPEIIYALPGRGRLRAQLSWIQVWATQPMPLFLGLAQGNREGQNWVWRLGIDYRVGQYVTAQVMYDGRRRPGRKTIHVGRMEMRAAF